MQMSQTNRANKIQTFTDRRFAQEAQEHPKNPVASQIMRE